MDVLTPILIALFVLLVMNFAAYSAFGTDKARATGGSRRIPESTLLLLALLGGTVGAFAGRKAFRHKTKKQPFSALLVAIAVVQAAAVVLLLGWWLAR